MFAILSLLSSTAFAESMPGQKAVESTQAVAEWSTGMAEMLFGTVLACVLIGGLSMILVPSMRTKGFGMLGGVAIVMVIISIIAFYKFSSFGMTGSLSQTLGVGIKR